MAIRIPLTQGKFAIVDAQDAERLSYWKWYAHRDRKTGAFYARRTQRVGKKRFRTILMHKEIFGSMCDHANRNSLDNRRLNLRRCSKKENARNRRRNRNNKSGYKGVYFHSANNRWMAQIGRIYLGSFLSKISAAKAYDEAALRLHKRFASPNFKKRDHHAALKSQK